MPRCDPNNCTDDVQIAGKEVLFRRVPPHHWAFYKKTGKKRLSSAAYQPPDLSVDIEKLGATPENTLNGFLNFSLVSFTAGQARLQKQKVCHDPLPKNNAHGLVVGKKTRGTCRQLRKGSSWVVPPTGVSATASPDDLHTVT